MSYMSCPRGMHVWRIKNHAINRLVLVWQVPAICLMDSVRVKEVIISGLDITPKDALSIGNISHSAMLGYIEF